MKPISIVTSSYVSKLNGNGNLKAKMNLRRKNLRKKVDIEGLHRLRSMKRERGKALLMTGRNIFLNRLLLSNWMRPGTMCMPEE
jgi:hypothetical protein